VATPTALRSVGNNGNGAESAPSESKPENNYVPPPSPLEMLRKQREARWNNNE
jgi:hypothetical protein